MKLAIHNPRTVFAFAQIPGKEKTIDTAVFVTSFWETTFKKSPPSALVREGQDAPIAVILSHPLFDSKKNSIVFTVTEMQSDKNIKPMDLKNIHILMR